MKLINLKKHIMLTAYYIFILASVSQVSNAQTSYKAITQLGTNQAICPAPGVQDEATLQAFFAKNPQLIKQILTDAKLEQIHDVLLEEINAGNFHLTEIVPDTTFEWMAMRKKEKIIASPKRIWKGKTPFTAFALTPIHECTAYQLIIPEACCNLALISTQTIETTPEINVSTEGSSITVCGDQKNEWFITDNEATTTFKLGSDNCTTFPYLADGDYIIKAAADCGQSEKIVTIAPLIAVDDEKPTSEQNSSTLNPFLSILLGSETLMRFEDSWQMYKRDTSGFLSARAGFKIPFDDSSGLYFVPRIGVIERTSVNDGIDYPDTSAYIDIGLEKEFSNRLSIGFGYGIWNVNDSEFKQDSIYMQALLKVNQRLEGFVEVRGVNFDGSNDNDGYSDNHAYSIGVRFPF